MSSNQHQIAGQATLKLITQVPDLDQLGQVLNHVSKNPVEVTADKIVLDESDIELVRPLLAEIGIEVSDPELASATDGGDPAGAGGPDENTTVNAYDLAEKALAESEDEAVGVMTASANDKHWLVIAGGNPIARISLSAQQHPNQLAAFFAKPDYWNTVAAAFKKNGVAATLAALKASVFTAEEIEAPETPDVEAAVKAGVDRYRQCLHMAFQASQRNLIPNQLKAATYDVSEQVGIEEPESVVEAIFAAADNFIDELDEQAAEYMDMDDSALVATQKMLKNLSVQNAAHAAVSRTKSPAAQAMTASLAAGNMPLSTAGFSGTASPQQLSTGLDRSAIRASLRLGRV